MMDRRLRRLKLQITPIILLLTSYLLFSTQIGCEAMRKKFVRTPTKEKASAEEVIYVPEEYPKYAVSPDETYQTHFMTLESWHGELLQRFEPSGNQKKWLDCIDEEVRNLEFMKEVIVSEEKKQLIDGFVQEFYKLREQLNMSRSVTSSDIYRLKNTIEQLGRDIHQKLSYSKIKGYLEKGNHLDMTDTTP